jgi:predicted flap endonuclease-1-like 5' DNA nuclease
MAISLSNLRDELYPGLAGDDPVSVRSVIRALERMLPAGSRVWQDNLLDVIWVVVPIPDETGPRWSRFAITRKDLDDRVWHEVVRKELKMCFKGGAASTPAPPVASMAAYQQLVTPAEREAKQRQELAQAYQVTRRAVEDNQYLQSLGPRLGQTVRGDLGLWQLGQLAQRSQLDPQQTRELIEFMPESRQELERAQENLYFQAQALEAPKPRAPWPPYRELDM